MIIMLVGSRGFPRFSIVHIEKRRLWSEKSVVSRFNLSVRSRRNDALARLHPRPFAITEAETLQAREKQRRLRPGALHRLFLVRDKNIARRSERRGEERINGRSRVCSTAEVSFR